MTGRIAALFMGLAGLLLASAAGALTLDGAVREGGVVFGQVAPGATVRLEGEKLRVSDKGLFVMGFGREAEGEKTLTVEKPGGETVTRTLDVAPVDWPVQRIDGLPDNEVTPSEEALEKIRADAAAIARARERDTASPFFRDGFVRPVAGPVSGVFGSQRILNGEPRSPHSGLDIAADKGTPVKAAAPGIVSLVVPDMFFTGRTVMLDHGHGLETVYAHMADIRVEEGERVDQGQTIGTVGESGRATGPHLHFGLSWFGTRLDPAAVVTGRRGGGDDKS